MAKEMCYAFLLISLFTMVNSKEEKYVIAETTEGNVQGYKVGQVRRFLGVPFAAPPVGDLRFKKPQAPAKWDGVRDATKLPKACAQGPNEFVSLDINDFSEDCLYLNIYMPELMGPIAEPLAVMVRIHGGALMAGSSHFNRPDYFDAITMKGNVIVVGIQYRVGLFGFLPLDHPDIHDNVGLWDQQVALTWIQKNIANFGGDPDRVTIFGESSGAQSICFHLLSPASAGLFQGAIVQSGALVGWLEAEEDQVERRTYAIAEKVGCRWDGDHDILVRCLKGKDEKMLMKIENMLDMSSFPFVDGDFIPDQPDTLWHSGQFNKVSLTIGLTSGEFLNVVFLS